MRIALACLDVAFVSPWNDQSIVRAGQRLDARRIVIYHHEAGEQLPECRDLCSVPQEGQTITIP